ncbi:unnamed protein product [Didymodactylos carnosus]|uniref:MARVEL domain-containing protein n=1 Tax=Didymodactylos carnosus TaxID=1234261 RepID=A0A813PPP9_9BILA|nr:unnamed protein product [Didymodactylos carnosus]CAF1531924.1 unnamed protein product [Didymodactylos carnosus]CAF3533595.1 unnamed protein product [Didymodactylos carnosus]CAF4319159.1 unnamed protein product [Didymodactylos carnosus]
MSSANYHESPPAPQGISCRPVYVTTLAGVLKFFEIFCDILALILAGAAPVYDEVVGHRGFFIFVAAVALIISFILLIACILNVNNVRWPAKYSGVYGAATFFGFAAFATYLFDGINRFRLSRSGGNTDGNPPQAGRQGTY